MLKIPYPIIVEGKYDKIKLARVLDAKILMTEGFGIFKKEEMACYLRKITEACGGIIVLTDSDGAGLVIRGYLKNILPPEKIIHLYTPRVAGKEKRKKTPSKEGILGVEGMDVAWIEKTFAPFATLGADDSPRFHELALTKADLYAYGLSGGERSSILRRALLRELALPENLSAKALLEALNLLVTKEEWERAMACLPRQD